MPLMDTGTKKTLSILTAVFTAITGLMSILEKMQVSALFGGNALPFIATFAVLGLVLLILQWTTLRRQFLKNPFAARLILAGSLLICALAICLFAYKLTITETTAISSLTMVALLTAFVLERYRIDSRSTTQYLGPFPKNLPAVIEAVQSANNSIMILTDVFAYGAFSAPWSYELLIDVLRKKATNRHMRITWYAYTPARAKSSVEKQLDLSNIRPNSAEEANFVNGEKMKAFLRHFPGMQPKPSSVSDVLEKVLDRNNLKTEEELREKGCEIYPTVDSEIPLYIWLIDNRLAIFSVPVQAGAFAREDAFVTQDPALLNVLEEMGQLHWSK